METNPTIYVLAGPNGVGKTTVNPFFVPNGVPYINADDIARQLHERLGEINVQELSNAQALERMNGFMALRQSFAIETNLADYETWQFLIGIRGLGYSVHLNFFCVSDVEICVDRVLNRVFQGGHFVRPDVVRARYETGLTLLRHFKEVPDQLILTDNTTESAVCAELALGKVIKRADTLPDWAAFILAESNADINTGFASLDEVRKKYQKMKDKGLEP